MPGPLSCRVYGILEALVTVEALAMLRLLVAPIEKIAESIYQIASEAPVSNGGALW